MKSPKWLENKNATINSKMMMTMMMMIMINAYDGQ